MNEEKQIMQLIKKRVTKALSEDDVMKICDYKCVMVTYDELEKMDRIEQLFDPSFNPHQKVLLLYLTKEDFGHWCCLTKKGNLITFFDPYGYMIDKELKFINDDFREESNQDYPHLTELLYDSPYKVEYNDFVFQNRNNLKINTCGRWCGLFMKFSDIGLKKFTDIFKKYKDYNMDYIATGLTLNI